jgi:hypothetical protein
VIVVGLSWRNNVGSSSGFSCCIERFCEEKWSGVG